MSAPTSARGVMHTLPLLAALFLASGPSAHAQDAAAAQAVTVFHDVNVAPMTSRRVLERQTVVVRGATIESIGPAGEVDVPEGATRVEGNGTSWLMPGLVDTHVHWETEVLFDLFLLHGVTTVFNLRGGPQQLAARQLVESGEMPGPTIYTSGPFVNLPQIATPEDAVKSVEGHVGAGFDFIKIHGDLDEETLGALADAAFEADLVLTGHAPRNLPFQAVLDYGMVWIAHAEEAIYTELNALDPAEIPAFAKRCAEADLWLTPTLSTFENIVHQWGRPEAVHEAKAFPGAELLMEEFWRRWHAENPYTGRTPSDWPQEAFDFQLLLVGAMHEAGVRLMAGTDTPIPVMIPGASMQKELETLARCGLDDYEVLVAATRHPGEFIAEHVDANARFGIVRPGRRADLILVASNPLEDYTVTAKPLGVLSRGNWLGPEALEEIRERLIAPGDGAAGASATEANAGD